MKKQALLNAPVSALIAQLGHGDAICIADAGLPIPDNVMRIDLALIRSIPSFLQVFDAVTTEMMVEQAVIASELTASGSALHNDLLARLGALGNTQGNTIALNDISHEGFKAQTQGCKAIIRTGECTPYANIILRAGVSF